MKKDLNKESVQAFLNYDEKGDLQDLRGAFLLLHAAALCIGAHFSGYNLFNIIFVIVFLFLLCTLYVKTNAYYKSGNRYDRKAILGIFFIISGITFNYAAYHLISRVWNKGFLLFFLLFLLTTVSILSAYVFIRTHVERGKYVGKQQPLTTIILLSATVLGTSLSRIFPDSFWEGNNKFAFIGVYCAIFGTTFAVGGVTALMKGYYYIVLKSIIKEERHYEIKECESEN